MYYTQKAFLLQVSHIFDGNMGKIGDFSLHFYSFGDGYFLKMFLWIPIRRNSSGSKSGKARTGSGSGPCGPIIFSIQTMLYQVPNLYPH